MERLKVLVLASGLSTEEIETVNRSLNFFSKVKDKMSIVFEDLIAKPHSYELSLSKSLYGYILILGSQAELKSQECNLSGSVTCVTLKVSEWSGSFRDQVISQLQKFVESWDKMETENKVVEIVSSDSHEPQWILQNLEQFERHIHLMLQNERPLAVFFEDDSVKLRDITKRLKNKVGYAVPVVCSIRNKNTEAHVISQLTKSGYSATFLMDVDEFMTHIKSMCLQLSGQPVHIKVES